MKQLFMALSIFGLALSLHAQPTLGLVAHYRFDGSVVDATGNTANTGAVAGNPFYTCGVEGQALSFNGQGDEVSIIGGPVNSRFSNEDVSIGFYFKPRGGVGTQYLLSKRSPSCFGGNEFYIIYTPGSRTVSAFFFETNERRVIATHQIDNTDCWQHLALVRESGRVRLFINGQLINVFSTINRIDVANNGDLIIGDSDCRRPTEFPFNGLIDELRIYNRALSEREAQELYTAPDRIQRNANILPIFLGDDFQVELSQTCGTVFSWSPTDGVSDPFSPTPLITPAQSGEITYELSISDTVTSCIARDRITFNVIDPDDLDCEVVFLPTAFTPNGDGLNDTYGISNPFAIGEFLSFEIYDRWGSRVFSASDPFQQWDGSYKGQTVNPGVVRYVLQWVCNGEERMQTGSISVLR